jgi:hypothetical protein
MVGHRGGARRHGGAHRRRVRAHPLIGKDVDCALRLRAYSAQPEPSPCQAESSVADIFQVVRILHVLHDVFASWSVVARGLSVRLAFTDIQILSP